MLEESIGRYQSRAIETAQVIALARDMRQAEQRGEQLGLTDDEVAFYDALEVNDSAVAVLGDFEWHSPCVAQLAAGRVRRKGRTLANSELTRHD